MGDNDLRKLLTAVERKTAFVRSEIVTTTLVWMFNFIDTFLPAVSYSRKKFFITRKYY
jgi:hypothetical protein